MHHPKTQSLELYLYQDLDQDLDQELDLDLDQELDQELDQDKDLEIGIVFCIILIKLFNFQTKPLLSSLRVVIFCNIKGREEDPFPFCGIIFC